MKFRLYKYSDVSIEHEWFAWHPILVSENTEKVTYLVWLETVTRRLYYGEWIYDTINNEGFTVD
jgi:hypothetical protein